MVGLAEAIEGHQLAQRHALAIGDLGEGVALPHRQAAGGPGASSGARRGWQLQLLADLDVVGLADAVDAHQLADADAQPVGNFRQGFARFDRDLSGQGRQGQCQGEDEGDDGAAHGHRGRWRHVKGRARPRPAPCGRNAANGPAAWCSCRSELD